MQRRALPVVGFFFVCVCAAFLPGYARDITAEPGGLPVLSIDIGAETFLEDVDWTADVHVYLRNGLAATEGRHLEPRYLQFWPPGMVLTIWAVHSIAGLDAYPRKMMWVSVFFWTLALSVIFFLFPGPHPLLRFVGLSSLWLLPDLRAFTFGIGSLLAESFSVACFLIGASFLWRAITSEKLLWFAIAGLTFGLAANYRIYYLMSLRLVLIALLAYAIFRALRGRNPRLVFGPALATTIFLATLVPWSIYKLRREGDPSWHSAPPSYTYARMWNPAAERETYGRAPNAQCKADPDLCALIWRNRDQLAGETLLKLGILTTLAHPLRVFEEKLANAPYFWTGRNPRQLLDTPAALFEGLLLLAAGIFGLVTFARRVWSQREPADLLAGGLIAIFLLYNLLLFTFLHYEWRYSMPLRCAAFFLPWLMSRRDVVINRNAEVIEPLQLAQRQ
jgi:hypothetical protein